MKSKGIILIALLCTFAISGSTCNNSPIVVFFVIRFILSSDLSYINDCQILLLVYNILPEIATESLRCLFLLRLSSYSVVGIYKNLMCSNVCNVISYIYFGRKFFPFSDNSFIPAISAAYPGSSPENQIEYQRRTQEDDI